MRAVFGGRAKSLGGSAAVLLLLACRSTPPAAGPAPGPLPRPEVTVTAGGDTRSHTLSAAALTCGEVGFDTALGRAGLGLRVAGRRGDLVLRRAELGPRQETLFRRILGVADDDYSRDRSFGWGDRIRVRSMRTGPPRVGFEVHLVPWMREDGRILLDVSAIARPPDGSLLPVLRGEVDVSGPGTLLLIGEAKGVRVFGVLLRLTVPGAARPDREEDAAPSSHRIEMESFVLPTTALAATLRQQGLPDRGGLGGIAVHRIEAKRLPPARDGLAGASPTAESRTAVCAPGSASTLSSGPLTIEIKPSFNRRDYSYRTRLRVTSIRGVPPVPLRHQEGDALLVVAWDSEGTGLSRALLIRVMPME